MLIQSANRIAFLGQPADYFVPMLQFNTNIAEASRLQGVDWYVYTSTVGVYQPAKVFKEDEKLYNEIREGKK